MNKCIFMGLMVADPEKWMSADGKTAITKFRLAVSRRYKREGEPDADFLSFVAFGKQAENIGKYFQKGQRILVETHCKIDSVEKDGRRTYYTSFIVDTWGFVGARAENGSEGRSDGQKQDADGFVSVSDTNKDLPWD